MWVIVYAVYGIFIFSTLFSEEPPRIIIPVFGNTLSHDMTQHCMHSFVNWLIQLESKFISIFFLLFKLLTNQCWHQESHAPLVKLLSCRVMLCWECDTVEQLSLPVIWRLATRKQVALLHQDATDHYWYVSIGTSVSALESSTPTGTDSWMPHRQRPGWTLMGARWDWIPLQ